MAIIVNDRVRELTSTTGTGSVTLSGAPSGFQTFNAGIGVNNQTYYTIADAATGAWEVGIGTLTGATTLARTQVLRSSNANALVNFGSGTKDVFVTYPADMSVSQADTGTAPNQIPLNQYLGSMAYEDNDSVNITGGVATVSRATITNIENNTDISNVQPSLLLDFVNGKSLDPRITFSRSTAAVFYDGKTVSKAEENLILQSQTFDNASWVKTGSTVTADSVAAPDGTTTAETLTASATTASHLVNQNSSFAGANLTHTVSGFIKTNTAQYAYVSLSASTTSTYWATAVVDLSAGTITQTSNGVGVSGVSTSITNAGNGWYRVVVTATFGAVANNPAFVVGISDTATPTMAGYGVYSWTAAGTEAIYIWGAQLEQRSAVTAYTPTTTQAITNYIPTLLSAPANVARFDHDPITAESKGLLIEEQRVNLVTYSEQFDNATWTKTNATITTNTIVAPDGTLTGDLIVEATGTSFKQLRQSSISVTSGTAYTGSVYVKPSGRTWFVIELGGTPLACSAYINLSTGAVGTQIGSPSSVTVTQLPNGWYRVTITKTATSTGTANIAFYPTTTDNVISYAGDGWSGVFIWGAQLEAGAFPTSYIKTEASSVTRSADAASMTGTNFSSWYNASEGTMYADASGIYGVSGTNYFVACVDDNTVNNEFVIRRAETQLQVVSNTNTVTYAALTSSFAASNLSAFKIAGAYKVDSFAASFSGGAASEDTSGIVVSGANTFRIGSPAAASGGRRGMTGYIRKLAYYPKRLANAELVEMTA